jgi:type VI secretion system protein ImpB
MGVHLEFRSLDDFSPARVVEQVEPLKKLKETRDRISDLMTRIDRNDELESALEDGLKELKKMREGAKKTKGGE